MKKKHTNWHEAAICALQIGLKDYSHLLQYESEYILGKNSYRIDLLIIRKLLDIAIPKNIAQIFKSLNIFEIKGVGSRLTTDAYYKTNGYAGLLIDSSPLESFWHSMALQSIIHSCYVLKKFCWD